MSASTYVGRIGALAAALGVGAVIFTGSPVAWAGPDSSGSSDTSDQSAAGSSQASDDNGSSAVPSRGRKAHPARGSRKPAAATEQSAPKANPSSSDDSEPDVDEADTPDGAQREVTEADTPDGAQRDVNEADTPDPGRHEVTARRGSDSAESDSLQSSDNGPGPAAATAAKVGDDAPEAATTAAESTMDSPESVPTVATPAPAASQTVTSLIETVTTAVAPTLSATSKVTAPAADLPTAVANVAARVSTVINSVVEGLVNTFSGNSPFVPRADSPINWLMLAAARRQPLAAASASAIGAETSPTLVIDGYYVVPSSTQIIDAFTGRWAFWPGQPNMIQGRQDFNLVDPDTGEAVGAFSALVTAGDPTSIGAHYVQMLVTANDGRNVGTEPGQTPPVGSLISEFTLGLVGATYSAMPTPSGDKVSVKLKTPFGAIALPLTFDAAAGIADRTFDNRPMDITGGFSIAPADPDAEKITATIGMLPLFNSVQGRQVFGIFDSDGKQVGSFDGEFTTTSDTLGIYTQAILVTGNDGTNVGTEPGQTPPVGTVYNVAYFFSDDNWLLYSSMPTESGKDAITLKFGTPKGVTDLQSPLIKLLIPQANFDASKEPAMKPLITPGGQKFVPVSDVIPSGVNGLPPRDVQIQGYQQFEVYDFLGRKMGPSTPTFNGSGTPRRTPRAKRS